MRRRLRLALLFRKQGRDGFSLDPVDLCAEVCTASSDCARRCEMRRDDGCATMNVLPPGLKDQLYEWR